MATGSKKAVYAALFGNLGIAITKFIAALISGSVSMWAETYHSASDTFNQILLLIGIKASTKPASHLHQFGYGKSQFFWSFIVATMIFGISGVLALQQGISSLITREHHFENPMLNYIVLIIAAIFEANALRIAYKQFKKSIENREEKITFKKLIYEFKESKDTTILTVIVEDSAALAGIAIAALGIFLTDITGNTVYDAIGSIFIGCLLMAFAFFLARENRGLLIGESITRRQYKKIVNMIKEIPEVNRIVSMRTMHLSPEDVIVGIEVNLIDNLDTDKIEVVTDLIEQNVMKVIPHTNKDHIFVEITRS
ncbi:MAG: cation diffusion facilitator family transporter [Nitrosopumilales archaeon]|nr:cation diffusion facilitator family transporter [Nitrosopumilales archaeon]